MRTPRDRESQAVIVLHCILKVCVCFLSLSCILIITTILVDSYKWFIQILQGCCIVWVNCTTVPILINSLRPSDTIWRHKSGSTLAQVMACCLTAPSHYLNQWWPIISKVHWHSSECNFTRDTSAISHCNLLENYLPGANGTRGILWCASMNI